MEYTIPVKQDKYYNAVLTTLRPYIGNLTDYEINLISVMLNNKIVYLDTDSRKHIRTILATDSYTLNNYIKRLRDKGVLVNIDGNIGINKNLTQSINDRKITINFSVSNYENRDI